jgi:hypothetical protein
LGSLDVVISYGFTDDGDRLRFMVIRAYPLASSAEERTADPRFDVNSGRLPLIRQSDGTMRTVGTDGRVYLFIGNELRTMRVRMNEHTDTIGLGKADSLEGMWNYLQQFRVADGRPAGVAGE